MDKFEKLEVIIRCLNESNTEKDIIDNLYKIVKGFSVYMYKDRILVNPYYKSVIIDVIDSVRIEMNFLRESIIKEMNEIDIEILKNPNVEKLKSLKNECELLLNEISMREQEMLNLI